MKRGLSALAVFLSTTALFAGDVTHAYLVGTRHAARESLRQISRDDVTINAGRNVEAFDIVDAFKSELTDAEAAALSKSPEVLYVEPDIPRHAFGAPHQTATNELRNPNGQTIPYGVYMVDAPSIWPATRGGAVNVAVLDTGIDINHPDLKAAYAGGYNTFATSSAPIDDVGHGTHVAGTVAATDNNIGVVGVAPGVRLWAVRVLRSDGKGSASGPDSNVIAGIQWVVQQKKSLGGNWIISMSLGSCQASATEASAVSNAINAGVLVVAAAGNHDPTQPDTCSGTSTDNSYSVAYPAAYPGVVAVAAVDSTEKAADFSNIGPEVVVAAPGVDVLSTVPLGTGSISYVDMSAGSRLASDPLTGSPVGTLAGTYVDCGLGNAASDFPAAVNGNIALIKRGVETFATKVKNAQAAGATAVIIYNKDTSGLGFTLTADTADAGHVWPLSVAVSLADGQTLLAQKTKTVTIVNTTDDYENMQGTSMATPHVSAVAALVWSMAPSATAAAVKQALQQSAHDLGDPGIDNVYGYGLVDALAAAKQLNPGAVIPTPTLGRSAGRRGH